VVNFSTDINLKFYREREREKVVGARIMWFAYRPIWMSSLILSRLPRCNFKERLAHFHVTVHFNLMYTINEVHYGISIPLCTSMKRVRRKGIAFYTFFFRKFHDRSDTPFTKLRKWQEIQVIPITNNRNVMIIDVFPRAIKRTIIKCRLIIIPETWLFGFSKRAGVLVWMMRQRSERER